MPKHPVIERLRTHVLNLNLRLLSFTLALEFQRLRQGIDVAPLVGPYDRLLESIRDVGIVASYIVDNATVVVPPPESDDDQGQKAEAAPPEPADHQHHKAEAPESAEAPPPEPVAASPSPIQREYAHREQGFGNFDEWGRPIAQL